jgi:phospholipid/cholesterol/gamma-HCH transport system substrate-binding protein
MSVRSDEIQAGGFLLVALILLVISIFTLGSERQLFGERKRFEILFRDVKGMREGAPVRLGGITIGRVGSIRFSGDPSSSDLEVSILVDEQYLDRIRVDSRAVIETQGLLGDRYLKIEAGESLEVLEPGQVLASYEPADIAEVLVSAGSIVDNTKELSLSLRELLQEFRAEGLVNTQKSLASLADILEEIQTGDGALNTLIYAPDKGEADLSKSITGTFANIEEITGALRRGEGALGGLIFDSEGRELITDLRLTVQSLRETSAAISKLAIFSADDTENTDKNSTAQLMANVNTTVENLKIASQALVDAQGTLGALLFDARLYDQALEITQGANKSVILREAVRASLPK